MQTPPKTPAPCARLALACAIIALLVLPVLLGPLACVLGLASLLLAEKRGGMAVTALLLGMAESMWMLIQIARAFA
jgi:hypothetical protein